MFTLAVRRRRHIFNLESRIFGPAANPNTDRNYLLGINGANFVRSRSRDFFAVSDSSVACGDSHEELPPVDIRTFVDGTAFRSHCGRDMVMKLRDSFHRNARSWLPAG